MSRWFRKPEAPPPEIVEQVEPVEIPVIIEVKRRLGRGDYRGAVRISYPRAVEDMAMAFNTPFPPHWTHEEFLRSLDEKTMGHLPEFLRLFYQVYAPIRYGPPATPIQYGLTHGPETARILSPAEVPEVLQALLKSIYAQPPMWRLYISPKVPPEEGSDPPPAAAPPERPTHGPEAGP
jgi:hypothetical protein